jgi:CDP-paratose 2-epimerase
VRPAVITGGAGFVGTNLADRLLRDGERVRVVDDLSRPGVDGNLSWLECQHGARLEVEIGDTADPAVVQRALRGAGSVFHLAAQVAVTTSLVDPLHDFDVNLRGTINVLEAARAQTQAPRMVFTSTNKVYGALADLRLDEVGGRYEPADELVRASGIGEDRPLDFCTPYGCSKGAADQYVLDYAKSFGLPTAVFRMSCIYGLHQCGNEDQGWVAHFAISALRGEPITLFGDGRQVRDVLFCEDLVGALLLARDRLPEIAGEAFNMGGGPANAVSLLQVVDTIGRHLGHQPQVRFGPWRQGDQRYYVTDTTGFRERTGWAPQVAPEQGITRLLTWLADQEQPRFERAKAVTRS